MNGIVLLIVSSRRPVIGWTMAWIVSKREDCSIKEWEAASPAAEWINKHNSTTNREISRRISFVCFAVILEAIAAVPSREQPVVRANVAATSAVSADSLPLRSLTKPEKGGVCFGARQSVFILSEVCHRGWWTKENIQRKWFCCEQALRSQHVFVDLSLGIRIPDPEFRTIVIMDATFAS